jgi:hypothetical protein
MPRLRLGYSSPINAIIISNVSKSSKIPIGEKTYRVCHTENLSHVFGIKKT